MPSASHIYYGWWIVSALAITETISWGILFYAYAAFIVPMQDDLGWSTTEVTGAFSLALLLSGLAAPLAGRWLDRHGSRVLMSAGSIAGTLLVVAWARVDNLVSFYLIWAAIGVAMAATLYEPAFATVTTWFERDRPQALLAVTLVAGFASTIFLPLAGVLIASLGWRDALLALAAILAIGTIPPHMLVLRRRPEDRGLAPDGAPLPAHFERSAGVARHGSSLREALHDRAFWLLALAFSLETFAAVAVGVHLIPFLTERGDGARFAAAVTGLIGAAQVAARILATLLRGRVSQLTMTALVFALQAVAVIVLLESESTAGVLLAIVLLGSGRGVVTLMRPALVAEFWGRSSFGAISGALALFLTGARALAPLGIGIAYEAAGSYPPVFWSLAAISPLGAVVILRLGAIRTAP